MNQKGADGHNSDDGGLWGSISRELTLGKSALGGIGHAFADLASHPETALAEFGSAAVIAGGLALAGRGGFFLSSAARIASTALAISFGKSLITSGTEVGGAVVDAWKSPNNLESDKQTVASVTGQFAVDMTAFGLGGYAGSRLAGLVNPSFLAKPLLRDGAIRFAEDPTVSTARIGQLHDTTGVRNELTSLLGTEKFDQRFQPVTVRTTFGDATVRPYYSRESTSLNLYLDSPKTINPSWLQIKLNAEGAPQSIAAVNDQAHLLPSVLKGGGYPQLAEASGRPTNFILADKMGRINYADVNNAFDAIKANKAPLVVDTSYRGKDALYVFQRTGESAPITTALGTTDMGPCSALIVIDKANGRHYLAHVDHTSNPELLRQSLSSFDLKKSDIYILEGPDNGVGRDSLLGSAQRAYLAVQDAGDRIRFLHDASGAPRSNVVIKNGKIYTGAETYVGL